MKCRFFSEAPADRCERILETHHNGGSASPVQLGSPFTNLPQGGGVHSVSTAAPSSARCEPAGDLVLQTLFITPPLLLNAKASC